MARRAPKRTELPKHGDKLLPISVFLLALILLLPLPDLLTNSVLDFNYIIRQAIPIPVALLTLGLPIMIHYGLYLIGRTETNDLLKEQERRERIRLTGRILFRSSFRPHLDGSSWKIVNFNKFAWTDTRILIEREKNGQLVCEKHQLGEVLSGQTLSVESELEDGDFVIWRIMVLTREGSQTDFPERGYRSSPEPFAERNKDTADSSSSKPGREAALV